MKKYMMRQCSLKKNNVEKISWIPEKFAKVGKYVKLKGDDGWRIAYVSHRALTNEQVAERSQDWKRTRKASDI